jgi:uracil-DNA glycosylase
MLIEHQATVSAPSWASEFAQVIRCTRCDLGTCRKILRDDGENVPQPGYLGSRYGATRLLLVGQNPGVGTVGLVDRDRTYTEALRAVGREPNDDAFQRLAVVTAQFVPSWPIHGRYFPLTECGLDLQDIAYCNVVRCRTLMNAMPSDRLAQNCIETHFRRWLTLLKPRAVVFIGKWPHDRAHAATSDLGIPSAYMNRQRSLSTMERDRNRREVVEFVQTALSLADESSQARLQFGMQGQRESSLHLGQKLVAAAKFLESNGMSEEQLSQLHHFSLKGRNVTYAEAYRYFSKAQDLKDRNADYANRLIFIANKYMARAGSLSALFSEALQTWPLR